MEENAWNNDYNLNSNNLSNSALKTTTLEASPLSMNDPEPESYSDDPEMSPRIPEDSTVLYNVDIGSASTPANPPALFQELSTATVQRSPSIVPPSANEFVSFLGTSVAPNVLNIQVCDPEKHGDGSQAYVSYSIKTSTVLDSFSSPELTVQRRFQDVIWLHNMLENEFPACILPPLPDKHRMEYLTGDRFGPDFIEKRRAALQRYLMRLARHTLFYKSEPLRQFLENKDLRQLAVNSSTRKNSMSTLDTLADTVMNAFAKSKSIDPKFVDAKDRAERLEKNLKGIEKYQARVIKLQEEVASDFQQLSQTLAVIAAMEVPVTEPAMEFVKCLQSASKLLLSLAQYEDSQFLANIEEYIGFSLSIKDTLRKRDEKQAEYEDLVAYLSRTNVERSETARSGHGTGIRGYIKGKMDEIRGTDIEQKKVTRVEKLDKKVDELNQAVVTSKENWQLFDKQVLSDLAAFETAKEIEFKNELDSFIDRQIVFWEQTEQLWRDLVPTIEGITIVSDSSTFPSSS